LIEEKVETHFVFTRHTATFMPNFNRRGKT